MRMTRRHLTAYYREEIIVIVFFRDATKFHYIHVWGVRSQATSSSWKTNQYKQQPYLLFYENALFS